MEEQILNIISQFNNNFRVINFNNEMEVEDINPNNINIQLRNGNINIDMVERNMQPLADILITFSDSTINIFSRISLKLSDRIVDNFIQIFFEQFNVIQRVSSDPRRDLPFRWDELSVGE